VIRWRAFTVLCGYLRAGLLDGPAPKRTSEVAFERLVELSSYEFVTPALAWSIEGQADVPPDVSDYLGGVLALNRRRNEHLMESLARAVGALNAVGIEPVLLKGAARLVGDTYPVAEVRFVGDLDVLIPAEAANDAVAALHRAGFGESPDERTPAGHHHLPMLHDRESGAGVELHTAVVKRAFDALVPTEHFVVGTRRLHFRDGRVRVPDPTRSVAHLIVHDHGGHRSYARYGLRTLLELAVMRQRHEAEIDWGEIEGRFAAAGHPSLLASYVTVAQRLFGQTSPSSMTGAPAPEPIRRFFRAVDPAGVRSCETAGFEVPASDIVHAGEHCWAIRLPSQFAPGDSPDAPVCSLLELFEAGRRLGPPHTVHERIRAEGKGAFSHWQQSLLFSTSDNSDPRTSGRAYTVSAPLGGGTR
jgi:hypothetical protein